MHSLELWRNFICGNETGSPGRAVSLHLARSGSQSEHRIRRILPARGACHIIIKIIVLCLPRYIYSLGCQVCFQKKTSIFIHSNLLTNFFDCRSFLDVILDIKRCRPSQSGSWYHHGSYYCHSHGIPQKFCAKGTMLGLFVVVHPYSLEV